PYRAGRAGGPDWRSGGPHAFLVLFQVARRIDRRRILADLEVQLRRVGLAAHAGDRDLLPALDLFAALDLERAGVAVDRDQPVLVAHQHGVAEFLEPIAGIDDDAVLGGLDRRAFRHRDVNAVVRLAA